MMETETEEITPFKQESKDQKLHRIYKKLEQEWDTIKRSGKREICASSVDSCSTLLALQLLDDSPRSLIASLQKGKKSSSSDGNWNVRNNDLAALEILRERRAAMESGNLKGRRLFEDENVVTDEDFGDGATSVGSWDTGMVQENDVRSYDFDEEDDAGIYDYDGGKHNLVVCPMCCECRSYSSSSTPPLKVENREEEEEEVSGGIKEEKRRMMTREGVIMLLVLVVFLVIGFLVSRKSGGYAGKEVILVPT